MIVFFYLFLLLVFSKKSYVTLTFLPKFFFSITCLEIFPEIFQQTKNKILFSQVYCLRYDIDFSIDFASVITLTYKHEKQIN